MFCFRLSFAWVETSDRLGEFYGERLEGETGFWILPVMMKRKERAVEELYNVTQIILEPEITPVLRGSCRIQGPVDDTDNGIQTNMVSPQFDKGNKKQFLNREVHIKAESGTCNVCFAPCSSCMHISRALMGPKSDDSTEKACHANLNIQHSRNDVSETSNVLTTNSSHDSFSENAESIAMVGDQCLRNKCEDLNGSEGLDGNFSCVSGANVDIKDVAFSSASNSCLAQEGFQKANNTKEAISRVDIKVESETGKDSEEPVVEASKRADASEEAKKVKEVPDVKEPPSQPKLEDESDESDIVEQDVKVCDICGDTGREDLLAICSRCSDGAEHTYCMRERLDTVPEGDWLCEECKLDEEIETQKEDKYEKDDKNGKNQFLGHVNTHSLVNSDAKESDFEGNLDIRVGASTDIGSKRPLDNAETASLAKRQALETSLGSPKAISSTRMVASLTKESSFKNLDKGKVRPVHQVSLASNSVGNDCAVETARSPTTVSRLQTPKGSLLKCNSFSTLNSKPKVKHVEMTVLQKQKQTGEPGSLDNKEGTFRTLSKSMSLRPPILNRSSAPESKVKRLSPKFSHVQDVKGSKHAKDQNIFERKNSFKSDVGSSKAVSSTLSPPRHDQKTLQAEGKLLISKPSNHLVQKGELKRQLSSTVTNEQKLNQVSSPKDELLSSSSRTAERPLSIVNGTNQGDKLKPLNSSREGISKGNDLKAAIEAAILKRPGINKKNRVPDQPEELSVSRDLNSGTVDSFKLTKPRFSNKMRDFDSPLAKSVLSKMAAIPEHECVWQGLFEVHRSGKPSELYAGIQAHLSNCASSKVVHVVNKLTYKIILNQVPRLSMWPPQFQDTDPKEDNIALYFFARDLESYERSYRPLLENMMRDDLAFKGNVAGVEFLIFPSNLLPEGSQRWNMLFYFWGVFRGAKMKCPEEVSGSSEKPFIPSLNVVPVDTDIPSSSMHLSEKKGPSGSDTKISCFEGQEDIHDSRSLLKTAATSSCHRTDSDREVKMETNIDINNSEKKPLHWNDTSLSCSYVLPLKEEEIHDIKMTNSRANQVESSNWTLNSRKRPHIDLTEPVSQASSTGTSHTQLWNEVNNNLLVDEGSTSKKLKTSVSSIFASNSHRNMKTPTHDIKENLCNDKATTERHFFPLEDFHLRENKSQAWMMEEENRVPNLELALGAETKPSNQGILPLPLFVGIVDHKQNSLEEKNSSDTVKSKEEEDEDDVSASLSLSLSFPFSDKEKGAETVSKTEQIRPERHRVNTSLLLFRGLSDN